MRLQSYLPYHYYLNHLPASERFSLSDKDMYSSFSMPLNIKFIALNKICVLTATVRTDFGVFHSLISFPAVLTVSYTRNYLDFHLTVLYKFFFLASPLPAVCKIFFYNSRYFAKLNCNFRYA